MSGEHEAFFNQYFGRATAEDIYGVNPGHYKADPEYRAAYERRVLASVKLAKQRYLEPPDEFTRARDQLDWARQIVAAQLLKAEQWEAQIRADQAAPPQNWDFMTKWPSIRAGKLRRYYKRFLRRPATFLEEKAYRAFRAAESAASKRIIRPLLDELRGAPTPRPQIDLKRYRHDADYRRQIADEVLCEDAAARVARGPKCTGSVLGLI